MQAVYVVKRFNPRVLEDPFTQLVEVSAAMEKRASEQSKAEECVFWFLHPSSPTDHTSISGYTSGGFT